MSKLGTRPSKVPMKDLFKTDAVSTQEKFLPNGSVTKFNRWATRTNKFSVNQVMLNAQTPVIGTSAKDDLIVSDLVQRARQKNDKIFSVAYRTQPLSKRDECQPSELKDCIENQHTFESLKIKGLEID